MYIKEESKGLIRCNDCGNCAVDIEGDMIISYDEEGNKIFRCRKCQNKLIRASRKKAQMIFTTTENALV